MRNYDESYRYLNPELIKRSQPEYEHDCANDGTCGYSITRFEKKYGKHITFYDKYNQPVAKFYEDRPEYVNNLYNPTESKRFTKMPTEISDVLPNIHTFKFNNTLHIVRYDDASPKELAQLESDYISAYEVRKEKLCISGGMPEEGAVNIFMFNNHSDFLRFHRLASPVFAQYDDSNPYVRGKALPNAIVFGKEDWTDEVIAHEASHVFGFNDPIIAAKFKRLGLDDHDVTYPIGWEVVKRNRKILTQREEERHRETLKQQEERDRKMFEQREEERYRETLKQQEERDRKMFEQREEERYRETLKQQEERNRKTFEQREEERHREALKQQEERDRKMFEQREEERQKTQQSNTGDKKSNEVSQTSYEFTFQHKDVEYKIYHKNLSEDEKKQLEQNIRSSHELIIDAWMERPLGPLETLVSVSFFQSNSDKSIEMIVFRGDIGYGGGYSCKHKEFISKIISGNQHEEKTKGSSEIEQPYQEKDEKEEEIQETQTSGTSFIGSMFIKPLSSVLSAIIDIVSWAFWSDEVESKDESTGSNKAESNGVILPLNDNFDASSTSADDVQYDLSASDLMQ